jgi:hypothetical protein
MSTATTTKPSKSKAPKADAQALQTAIAEYALARAGTAVGKLPTVELAPGSYPFALDVNITGELLVEQGTGPGATETIAGVSQGQALAGLIASLPPEQRVQVLSNGLAAWRDGDKAAQDAMLADMQSVLLTACKKRRMTTEHTPSGRKGAVKCKPSVRITGSAGAQSVEVEIAA